MKQVVVLSGAGITAESGLKTFRDSGGLWEEFDIMEVASYAGWLKNPERVIDFYNKRRNQLLEVFPNEGHRALARLEEKYIVYVVTQNVDDLHERAGSQNVLHLHGQLLEVRSQNPRSTIHGERIKKIKADERIKFGDTCDQGYQIRPNIVWFGEEVPMIEEAQRLCSTADIFIVVGTSLQVYPAAGLIDFVPKRAAQFLMDPNIPEGNWNNNIKKIQSTATIGLPVLVDKLMNNEI
jgi:NAD-dependent deacetylase